MVNQVASRPDGENVLGVSRVVFQLASQFVHELLDPIPARMRTGFGYLTRQLAGRDDVAAPAEERAQHGVLARGETDTPLTAVYAWSERVDAQVSDIPLSRWCTRVDVAPARHGTQACRELVLGAGVARAAVGSGVECVNRRPLVRSPGDRQNREGVSFITDRANELHAAPGRVAGIDEHE
jgi:hypothetical protein